MSGYEPQGYDPRRRPATPPQWQPLSGRQQMEPWPTRAPSYGPVAWQQPPYYPPQVPQVAPKSTAAGLMLGLLPPCGIGCMYAGHPGIGITLMVFWLLSIPLTLVFGIGILLGLAIWITSAVLGYTLTRQWNRERGIIS